MATQQTQSQTPDILQQFNALLKTHSIVVSDRENLTKLFECIVDLCTQMPKTKLKAALKIATKETKTQPKAKTQPKTKAQPQPEELVGPVGAGDAPMLSDLAEVKSARGRGRPRKETVAIEIELATAVANANPDAETAEKKRRGRPKKDKSVTISSNDDEDALIEKMMADVASMKKDEVVESVSASASASVAVAVASVAAPAHVSEDHVSDEETEDEASSHDETESLSPVIHTGVPSFEKLEVEVLAPLAPLTKATKEPKAKATKEPKAKATKEPKAKEPKAKKATEEPKAKKAVEEPKAKATKEPKAKKATEEPNAKKATEEPKAKKAVEEPKAKKATEEPVVNAPTSSDMSSENEEIHGNIYLRTGFPRSSFTYSGKTYLRTETDNVYDNLTYEMIGVWDHANHEIISTLDVEELWFSDEE